MKFYKNTLLAGSLSAALVLGACSTASASDDMEWQDEGNEGTAKTKTEETSEFKYSVQDAVDLAGERFEGVVTEVELDEDDGIYHYDIEMENGKDEYEVEINAEDLSIMKEETDRDDDRESVKENQEMNTAETDAGQISMDEAVKIAKDEVGGGDVYDNEFDEDDNEYDIEVIHDGSEYELQINASTGEVKEIEQDDDDRDDSGSREAAGSFISSDEAAGIALDAAGGGTVKEWELDKEDNEYDFEIDYDGHEYEVEINATSGEVLDVEQDD